MDALAGEGSDDVGAAFDGLADLDLDVGVEPFGDGEFGAGAELDHAEAFAAL